MFGGVAQTYCLWKIVGEPYKKNNAYYVKVTHPITKSLKEVRFYTDKKHADLMPKKDYGPMYKVFGFKSANDEIFVVNKKDITDAEEDQFFKRKWRFGMFFGGVWYAPAETELPAIGRQNKIRKVGWAEFKLAGQAHSRQLAMMPENESPWFKED